MDKDDYALLKYSVIASFINGTANTSSARKFSYEAASKSYFYKGEYLNFNEETIRKWIKEYKEGYDNLKRKTRSDKRKPRSLDEDILIRIDDLKIKYPKLRSTVIYKTLINEGYFLEDEISIRTFQRFIKTKNYLSLDSNHDRRTYSFKNPNDSWQSDTTSGPYIIIKGVKYKTYIIVFIDDHSRLIVGAKAYFKDNALNMQDLLKESIRVYGVPKQLYCDNGGPYSNKQLKIICAKLGINLKNARPYDPESKGKIERFNRTLKDTWMNSIDWNLIRDLDDLNDRLSKYINSYNNSIHSSLKVSPNEEYYKEASDIRFIEPDKLDEYFYHTVKRKVNKTGCVKIENRVYELDYSYLGQIIEVTYNPSDLSKVIVNKKEYYLLDSISNSTSGRKKNADYSKVVNKENEELKEYEG